MDLTDQINHLGRARVLVVLKPEVTRVDGGRAGLMVEETINAQQDAAHKLKGHFTRASNSRAKMLASEMAGLHGERRPASIIDPREREAVGTALAGPRYFPNLGVMFGEVDAAGLAALSGDADLVDQVLPAPEFSLIRPEEPSALAGPEPGPSWAIRRMRVDRLWDQGLTGEGVVIGHLDTGVDASHPALSGAVDAYARFDQLGGQEAAAQPRDSGRHGTHTAGLMVGREHDQLRFGVAPGATLASAEVIEGGDIPGRVVAGLDWCVGQGVRIVNLSLGVRTFAPQFAVIMGLLRRRGVLPIAAVGNEGPQTSRSPGNLPETLSVGAADEQDAIWHNSSSQQFTDPKRTVPTLIAPGAPVFSCVPGGVAPLSGTSMASPHVAGLAALLLERRPELTVDALEQAIVRSCSRPPSITTLRGGRGVPDAVAALERI